MPSPDNQTARTKQLICAHCGIIFLRRYRPYKEGRRTFCSSQHYRAYKVAHEGGACTPVDRTVPFDNPTDAMRDRWEHRPSIKPEGYR